MSTLNFDELWASDSPNCFSIDLLNKRMMLLIGKEQAGLVCTSTYRQVLIRMLLPSTGSTAARPPFANGWYFNRQATHSAYSWRFWALSTIETVTAHIALSARDL